LTPLAAEPRAWSDCRFALPLIHFIPYSLTYSVPLFLKRQCDRTLARAPVHAAGRAVLAAQLRLALAVLPELWPSSREVKFTGLAQTLDQLQACNKDFQSEQIVPLAGVHLGRMLATHVCARIKLLHLLSTVATIARRCSDERRKVALEGGTPRGGSISVYYLGKIGPGCRTVRINRRSTRRSSSSTPRKCESGAVRTPQPS
jgi:hypothetical protein